MGMIIAILLCIIGALLIPILLNRALAQTRYDRDTKERVIETPGLVKMISHGLRFGLLALGGFLVLATSFVTVGDNEAALMKRIYFASDLESGKIIAVGNTKGPRAEIIGPGFHFIPGLNILHDVEIIQIIEVPPGSYATLSARDGKPLPPGVTYAPSFQGELNTYLDAVAFLSAGDDMKVGYKGPQATVLPPGKYRLNTYLWNVSKPRKLTNVPEGTVAVIKANTVSSVNFGSEMTAAYPENCAPTASERGGESLSTPLVPVGCVGIWDTALGQGQYYINEDVYSVTLVPVRVQAWEYEGGFTSRTVSLSVDQKGDISQNSSKKEVPFDPESSAAPAIDIKINGYTIWQGARILVQVDPSNAPFIVASVGGLQEVEDRIVTPATQSTLRDLAGTFINVTEAVMDDKTGKPVIDDDTGKAITRQVRRPIEPMDLITNREKLQSLAEEKIRPEGEKAGVTIREVRFLKPDLPPEVLLPSKRTQLAFAMVKTMEQERLAQQERIAKENAAATADQQPELVKAQIAVERALQYEQERDARGRADRKYLEEVAKGQEVQATVLGKDIVARLKMLELVLDNPAALDHIQKTVPGIVVVNGGSEAGMGGIGSLEGLAAVLTGGGVLQTKANEPVIPKKTDIEKTAQR